MNRLVFILSLALLSLIFFACSSSRNIKSIPPFQISKIILAKGINKTGPYAFPVDPSNTFDTQDSEIVSYVEYANLVGDHELKWEWYAVIIGISKYRYTSDNLTNLPFADDDAKAIRNMLSNKGGII